MNEITHTAMDDYIYYAHKYLFSSSRSTELWKVNRKLNFVADEDSHRPRLSAYIGLSEDLDDRIPKSSKYERCGKISQETFNKCWNESFAFLQKARLHDGEYYIERLYSGSYLVFHAFLRSPSKHYKITCRRDVEYALIDIGVENSIMYRRGVANRHHEISESVFCQAFKLVLDFFYDGAAMPANLGTLWDVLDSLAVSDEPGDVPIINEGYHYQKARELMLKRKDEIKLRLLEYDDTPSKRRELRAEMKGIDYCVSILDENH